MQQPSSNSIAVVLSTEQQAILQSLVPAAPGATQTTQAALLASIGSAGDAAGASTVIGLLKQIVINTAA